MATPDVKTLDLAWLGSGVFAKVSTVDTTSLDVAHLETGVFAIAGGDIASSLTEVPPITCSHAQLLTPSIDTNIAIINATPITCSQTKILTASTNAVFRMDIEVPIELCSIYNGPHNQGDFTYPNEAKFWFTQQTINTNDYDGECTYYFEVTADNDDTIDCVVTLINYNTDDEIVSVTVPYSLGDDIGRVRSTAFTPVSGSATYGVKMEGYGTYPNGTAVHSAKIIIVQKGATKTRIQIQLFQDTDYEYPSSTDYVTIPGGGIWLKTESHWENVDHCNLEIKTYNVGTHYLALYNYTDSSIVAELSAVGNEQYTIGDDFEWDATNFHDGDEFIPAHKSSLSYSGQLYAANLFLTLTDLQKVEIQYPIAHAHDSTWTWATDSRMLYTEANYSVLNATYWDSIGRYYSEPDNEVDFQLHSDLHDSGTASTSVVETHTHLAFDRIRSEVTLTDGYRYITKKLELGIIYGSDLYFYVSHYQIDIYASISATILTAQQTKIIPPEVTATTQHSGQADAVPLTASHAQLLAPTLPSSKEIVAEILTVQHTKILSPTISVGILSPILTAQHAKILASIVSTIAQVTAIPLTAQQTKLLAPSFVSSIAVAAPVLTAQHAQLLTPSIDIDVLFIEIERRIGASGEWIVVDSGYWNGITYEYIDTDLTDGTIYYYRAHTYDGESEAYFNTNVVAYLGDTVSLTISSTKLLAPTISCLIFASVPCLTCSHAQLLTPTVTLLANVQIAAPVLTAQQCKLVPPSVIVTSILDSTITSAVLTCSHAKLLAPSLVVVSVISAVPLTASAAKILAPSLILQSYTEAIPLTCSHAQLLAPSMEGIGYVSASILTASNTRLLAPTLIQSQLIDASILTAQHVQLLAPTIGALTEIVAVVLTCSHAQILAPAFITSINIEAIPLTATQVRLLSPTITMNSSVSVPILTCSHAQILAPVVTTAKSATVTLTITIHCSHCKLLAPSVLAINPASYLPSMDYYIGPDTYDAGNIVNNISISYDDGTTESQQIVTPFTPYGEDKSLYEKIWFKVGTPFKVNLDTYDINNVDIDDDEGFTGTAEKVVVDGVTCLKLSTTCSGSSTWGSNFWVNIDELVFSGHGEYSMEVKFVIPGANTKEWSGTLVEFIGGATGFEDKVFYATTNNWYTWQQKGINWRGVRRQLPSFMDDYLPSLNIEVDWTDSETTESAYFLIRDITVQEWRKVEDLQCCAFWWNEGEDITRPSASIIDNDRWFSSIDWNDNYVTDVNDLENGYYVWDYENPSEVGGPQYWDTELPRDYIYRLSDDSLIVLGDAVRYYDPLPPNQIYRSTDNGATWSYIGGFNDINSTNIFQWSTVDSNDTIHRVEFYSTSIKHLKGTYSNGVYSFGTATTVATFSGASCGSQSEVILVGDNLVVFWYNRTDRKYHMTTFNKDTDSYSDEVVYTVPSYYSSYGDENTVTYRAFYTGGVYHLIIGNQFTTGSTRVYGPTYYIKGTSGSWSTPFYMYNRQGVTEFFTSNPANILALTAAGAYNNKIYFFLCNGFSNNDFEDYKLFYIEDETMKELPLILTEPDSVDWWDLMDATVTTDGKLVSAWWGPGHPWQWQQGYTHAYLSCLDLVTNTYRGDNTIIPAHLLLDIYGFYPGSWDEGRVVTPCNFKTFSRISWEDDAIWHSVALNRSNIMGVIQTQKGEEGIYGPGNLSIGPRVPRAVKYPGKYSRR